MVEQKWKRPEYRIWKGMIRRCSHPEQYPRYAGRGISVCARWLESFDNFLEDMGPRPSLDYSIDRIDNDGNYEPGNCRWATLEEQMANRQFPYRYVEHNGAVHTLSQWARILSIHPSMLRYRLNKGKTIADVIDELMFPGLPRRSRLREARQRLKAEGRL